MWNLSCIQGGVKAGSVYLDSQEGKGRLWTRQVRIHEWGIWQVVAVVSLCRRRKHWQDGGPQLLLSPTVGWEKEQILKFGETSGGRRGFLGWGSEGKAFGDYQDRRNGDVRAGSSHFTGGIFFFSRKPVLFFFSHIVWILCRGYWCVSPPSPPSVFYMLSAWIFFWIALLRLFNFYAAVVRLFLEGCGDVSMSVFYINMSKTGFWRATTNCKLLTEDKEDLWLSFIVGKKENWVKDGTCIQSLRSSQKCNCFWDATRMLSNTQ